MRYFADALTNVVESEIPENRELLSRVLTLAPANARERELQAPANLAYTSFFLTTALQHGPLEILAAILPCTWSYGDIASSLESVADHPVYAEWVRFFGCSEYGAIVSEMCSRMNEEAAGCDEATLARLSYLFTTSTRLERGFWDMAYGLEQWPDVRAHRLES
jgi:thiaminase/transcriptional activator TenA